MPFGPDTRLRVFFKSYSIWFRIFQLFSWLLLFFFIFFFWFSILSGSGGNSHSFVDISVFWKFDLSRAAHDSSIHGKYEYSCGNDDIKGNGAYGHSILACVMKDLQELPPYENWATKAKYVIYMETRDVVRRLFCLLKLRSCRNGKTIMMMVVMMLTQREFPQPSAFEK